MYPNFILQELQQAHQARQQGNEGKARVCARRAAGTAAGIYLARRGITSQASSAYKNLETLKNLPDLPTQAYQFIEHLLLHVNEDFNLPADIDLIDEASNILAILDFPPE